MPTAETYLPKEQPVKARIRLMLIALLGTAAGCASAQAGRTEAQMSYLDNGNLRIGIDLRIGGAITYVSKSGSTENLINSADWGRQIQMSHYSGPVPFKPNGK